MTPPPTLNVPSPPPPATRKPPLTVMQALALIGVVVGLLVMLDLNQRLAAAQRLEDARNQLSTEVAVLENEQVVLQTQVAYATSDAAVIQWAHEGGKLAQPGEVLVIPIVPTAQPTPIPPPPPAPPVPPNWILWWNLFFDTPLES